MDHKFTILNYAKQQHRDIKYSSDPRRSSLHTWTRFHPLTRRCLLRAAVGAVAVAVAAAAASIHLAVDKLGEIDDEVLVPSRSKFEVEEGLGLDSLHEQLHKREAVNT